MFRGTFDHAIDAKGRTSFPAKFRDVLAASGDLRLVVTRSPFDDEPCLHVFPWKAWEEVEAKIAGLPRFDANAVRLRRLYVAGAHECDLDPQGRLLVPGTLREFAGLARDVRWAAAGHMIELWSSERWATATAMSPAEQVEFRRAVAERL